MNLRFTLFALGLLMAAMVVLSGCASTPTPAPTTVPPTTAPTALPQPTTVPTNTALPPTPTLAPTVTKAPPTNTPIPTTPAPTATNTRPPVTAAPPTAAATATATAVVMKYEAPELIEPKQGDTRRLRRDAFVFRWNPVGDLQANECYQLRLRIKSLVDPTQDHYGEVFYLADNTCNSAVGSGVVEFVVNGRPPAPDYTGLVAEADGKANAVDSQQYQVTWDVRVVLNDNGTLTPISPTSALGEFVLLNQ